MSRIGKLAIKLPEGVEIKTEGRSLVKISGPKGVLETKLPKNIAVEEKEAEVLVTAKLDDRKTRALHGTFRALINNMVFGVSQGWSKQLELVGIGYRAELSGKDLTLSVGFTHPVQIKAPEGITFKVEKTLITINGIEKQAVGQIAATIRAVRPPEPYKGKGIRYVGEEVRRKPGKAMKTEGAGA